MDRMTGASGNRRAKESSNNVRANLTVRKGDVRRAIIVRTKKETRRPDGRYIRFDDNAGVLLNNKVCVHHRSITLTREIIIDLSMIM